MSTFLLADDFPEKRQMMKLWVEKSGIAKTILEARNTEEAKELIDAHDIDWAFIDYEMPSELGPAVIAYLKQKNENTKAAIVSSADNETYRAAANNSGADAYVCTSYDSETVERRIGEVLEEWKVM